VRADGQTLLRYDVSFLPPGDYRLLVEADWNILDRTSWGYFFDINYYRLDLNLHPLGPYTDLHELNGLPDQATQLRGHLTYELPPGWQRHGIPERRGLPSIHPALETDYYALTLDGWGQSKNGITVTPNGAVIQVQLQDGTGNVISQSNLDAGKSHFVSLQHQRPGNYRLRVKGTDSSFATYGLRTQLVGLREDSYEPNNTSTAANRLLAGLGSQEHTIHRVQDEDWFEFQLDRVGKSPNQISIETIGPQDNVIGHGRLSLQLFDATGSYLASASVEDGIRILKLAGLQSGTYYARVGGNGVSTNSYRLRYDLVTTSRLPYVIGQDGYPVTRVTNSPANDDDPLVQHGLLYWALSEAGSNRWSLMRFDSTAPNARPKPIVQNIDSRSSDPPLFHVDGSLVVWQAYDGTDNEIFYFDGEAVQRLTNNTVDDRNPRVDNGRVVWQGQVAWQGQTGADWEIFLYDENGIRQLTENYFDDQFPQIAENLIAWHGRPSRFSSQEIFTFDLEDPQIRQLTENSADNSLANTSCTGTRNGCRPEVQVSSRGVVWKADVNGVQNGNEEIWFYDKGSGLVSRLFVSDGFMFNPVISDRFIAWQSTDYQLTRDNDGVWHGQDSDAYNIFVYDFLTVRQLTDYRNATGYAEFPWPSADRLIWHQEGPDRRDPEIMVYENGVIRQLTNNEFWENHFREGNGQVTWTNREVSGGTDIYLIDIAPEKLRAVFTQSTVEEGAESLTLRISREFTSLDSVLSVNLIAETDGQLVLPAIVTIPQGEAFIDVPVNSLNNLLLDGDRTVHVFATSPGFQFGEAEILILDREELALELSFSGSFVFEDAGDQSIAMRIHRMDTSLEKPITVDLSFEPMGVLSHAGIVQLPAGESFFDVKLDVLDNSHRNEIRNVVISAQSAGFHPVQSRVQVADTEKLQLTVRSAAGIDGGPVAEGSVGQLIVRRNPNEVSGDLAVYLGSNLPGDVVLPESIIMGAGMADMTIDITFLDGLFADGTRRFDIRATADGFETASVQIDLLDNDVPTLLVDPGTAAILQQLRSGGEASLSLNRQPTAPVTVQLTGRGGTSVTPASFVFDPTTDWRSGQKIVLTATPPPGANEAIVLFEWRMQSLDPALHGLAGNMFVVANAADPAILQGDLNGDGIVDAADAGILFANWGGPGPSDLNGDGVVDAADAGMLFANWDAPTGSTSDLNDDGAVDAADAATMFGNWGSPGAGDVNEDGTVDAADVGLVFANWTGDSRTNYDSRKRASRQAKSFAQPLYEDIVDSLMS
jgi:hypothetical protein